MRVVFTVFFEWKNTPTIILPLFFVFVGFSSVGVSEIVAKNDDNISGGIMSSKFSLYDVVVLSARITE